MRAREEKRWRTSGGEVSGDGYGKGRKKEEKNGRRKKRESEEEDRLEGGRASKVRGEGRGSG